jgi:3-deoxy-D-manno-octulosonate 8-phosphate phosphatase (KDO 8-P phosphatase)
MNNIQEIFRGQFLLEPVQIQEKLSNIKAIIADWDGVFNKGVKSRQTPSHYSEIDSMGTNLVRYSFWLKQGQVLPFVIITGADNPVAIELTKREKFTQMYSHILHKEEAMWHFCEKNNLAPENIAFIFDDANDLNVAKQCGLRFAVKRLVTPLFTEFVKENNLADYVTEAEGGKNAVREITELLMYLQGNYKQVLEDRMQFNTAYREYWTARQAQMPKFFQKENSHFTEIII